VPYALTSIGNEVGDYRPDLLLVSKQETVGSKVGVDFVFQTATFGFGSIYLGSIIDALPNVERIVKCSFIPAFNPGQILCGSE
jgi:hypothetical protein